MPKLSNWKGFERKIAKKFRGIRIIRQDYSTYDLDVVAQPFGIECKYRKGLSNKEVDDALYQVEDIILSIPERKGLIPLVVYQIVGTVGKIYVGFRLSSLMKLGLISEIKNNVEDTILTVQLERFLTMLKLGGVDYGSEPKYGVTKGSS